MSDDATFILKSGTNKGHRRIWIEGKRLLAAGLKRGDILTRNAETPAPSLMLHFSACLEKVHRVAGSDSRPIIDLNGAWVSEFIGDNTHFQVGVLHGRALRITPGNKS